MKRTGNPHTAMVLAAGLGTRMRPLTLTMPKPLVPVAGKPLLAHVLKPLFDAQLARIVINAHHLSEQIHSYVESLAAPSIMLSDESDCLLDSGGGIKKALPLLGADPFYILNADSFWLDGPHANLHRLDNTPDGPFSLSTLFRQAATNGRLFGLELDGLWMHVGTITAIDDTERRLRSTL